MNMEIGLINILLPQMLKRWNILFSLLINIQMLEKPDMWEKVNDSIT